MLYSRMCFACRSQGQLGLGDCKSRLRPEVVRSLKAAHCVQIAAGGHHSMVISHPLGLLFGFGSNSHGQLGQGQNQEAAVNDAVYSSQDRIYVNPTVVDYFRDKQVVDVACGRSHTLVVCRGRGSDGEGKVGERQRVYSMGLNSSGQCGVGHLNNIYRPVAVTMPSHEEGVGGGGDGDRDGCVYRYSVHSGPLSFHSAVVRSRQSSAPSRPQSHRHLYLTRTLPAVNSTALERAVDTWRQAKSSFALTELRDMIAESFSSIAVLNASFRPVRHADDSEDLSARSTARAGIELDLQAVRRAYATICSTNEEKASIAL
jgi:hypothetical protein